MARRFLAAAALLGAGSILWAQIYASNLPADEYLRATPADPVAALIRDHVKLDSREGLGYLPSLLEHLGISADSQALVFSKTSFQAEKISPRNPRAIYFNDTAAVGWVRGASSMEVAAIDPQQGVIFYTLDAEGRFERQQVCLKCHQGAATMGVPGLFVGSVFPDPSFTGSCPAWIAIFREYPGDG